MESMSSNLKASLPLNIEDDTELTDRFKDSALSITTLFKHAQKSRKAAFAQGYSACVSDLRDYIRANAEPERPLTVGVILDLLEGRQLALLRELEGSSSLGPSKSIQGRPAKSPSPPSLRKSSSPPPQVSRNIKRMPSKTGLAPLSPPRVAPWSSPSLSPTPLPEPAWPNTAGSEPAGTITSSWPEVSILPMLPIAVNPELSLPGPGTKRKRDALAEVEVKNNTSIHFGDHHRRHGGPKKRKGNFSRGGIKSNNGSDDWNMNMDEDNNERDRKRVRG